MSGRPVLQNPTVYIDNKRVQIDRCTEKLSAVMKQKILKERQRYAATAAAFDAMSPLKVLGRGYAIAHRADGLIVKTKKDVSKGDYIRVRLQKDEINCIVD